MALWGRDRRRGRDDRASEIENFWRWWSDEGADACAHALGEKDTDTPARLLTPRVRAIARDLAWELAPGTESVHLLVVTADGDPDVRALARRWLRAAPEPGPIWSYADARRPVTDLSGTTLEIDGADIDLASVQVGVRRRGSRVDVTVHHPAMVALGRDQRTSVAFLALDSALGEEQTETWIGELEATAQPPLDGFGLSGLVAVVRDLRQDHLDEDGDPVWVVLQGEGPRGPVLASAQVPLAAASAPTLDTHVGITLPYADRSADGLPSEAALAALRGFEDTVAERLGGVGRLVAHETSAGARTLHVYVDGTTAAVHQLTECARQWPHGRVTAETEHDPGWSAVQHLRG